MEVILAIANGAEKIDMSRMRTLLHRSMLEEMNSVCNKSVLVNNILFCLKGGMSGFFSLFTTKNDCVKF